MGLSTKKLFRCDVDRSHEFDGIATCEATGLCQRVPWVEFRTVLRIEHLDGIYRKSKKIL